MSLINQMLKDLEQRGAGSTNEKNTIPLKFTASEPQRKLLPSIVIISFFLVLIAGVYFWIQKKEQSHSTNITKETVTEAILEPLKEEMPVATVTESTTIDAFADEENNETEVYKPKPMFEHTLNFVPKEKTQAPNEIAPKKIAENQATEQITVSQKNTTQITKSAAIQKQDTNSANEKITDEKYQNPIKAESKPLPKSNLANSNIVKNIRTDQKSDHYYHLALSNLQQGRVSEAQDNLTRALELSPTNHEARQTLASLLLDNKRHHDAMTILANGLSIAPEQNDFRIALARLQVDANDNAGALITLDQGLAYANTKNSADFQGFLAAMLQRAERHEEAISHYKSSLSLKTATPNNTTNALIGLGISLQALNNLEDAKLAFTNAQTSQALSQELSIFVAQQLRQIDQRLSQ